MRTIKLVDGSGNIDYIKGNESTLRNCNYSLIKVTVVGEESGKRVCNTHFFRSYGAMQEWCEKNEKKHLTRGTHCSGLKMGNSKDNYLYEITA